MNKDHVTLASLESQTNTLAIYGDSFAREASPSTSPDDIDDRTKDLWLYNSVIGEKYRVTNYALQGSDFAYSYNLFKNTHHNYDKIIFIVTEARRINVKIDNEYIFIHNPHDMDLLLDNFSRRYNINEHQIKRLQLILDALKYYYVYVKNDDLLEAGVEHLVDQIRQIRPDAIVEYAFLNQFSKSNFCLCHVSDLDNKFLPKPRSDYICARPGHMSIENNKIFANYIRKKLDGENITISIDDFVEPPDSSINKFFIEIKS